jgi:hypothetical protein
MSRGAPDSAKMAQFGKIQDLGWCAVSCNHDVHCLSFMYDTINQLCVLYNSTLDIQLMATHQQAFRKQCTKKYRKYLYTCTHIHMYNYKYYKLGKQKY